MLESVTANEILAEVEAAEQRIRPHIRRTYLEHSVYYSQLTGANVFFKCENLQHTGSFKTRGALSKVLSLSEPDRARGVVSASTGNHGAAVAFAANKVSARALIFVPDNASTSKLAAIDRLGADVGRVVASHTAHFQTIGDCFCGLVPLLEV